MRRTKLGTLQVLLVSSRRSGRWGLPKGHIEAGETSNAAAQREAFEEAGVRGSASEMSFGSFTYTKDSVDKLFHVTVHLIDTHSVARCYPEKALRAKRWFSLEDAARHVGQAGLRELIHELVQSNGPGPPEKR
ncbi:MULTISPECIES: NUDIX hydrolase [unclassified Rhizobium]|uniref:NUDIX hydrolase n=1 Tax=Rhizobium sp. PP-CC-3G-465 TaxID=2135648 RepID=UPI000DA11146